MRKSVAAIAALMICVLGACGDKEGNNSSDPGTSASTDTAADTKVLDVCGSISADEVGSIVGATFASEVGPFDACEYSQDDARATSVAIDSQLLTDLGGGYEGYKQGTAGALTGGDTADLSGVGDMAFVTTGTFAGGENTQLQGAVVVGGQLISVNLTQGSGIEASVLIDQATQLLKLVVSKV